MRTTRTPSHAVVLLSLLAGCGGKAETLADSQRGDDGGLLQDAGFQGLDSAAKDAFIVEADCGPGLCIDCACTCPDGTVKAYGGCFSGCEDIPEAVKNCSMDCPGMCGPSMQPCPNGNECPAGFQCLTPPCEDCPVQATPICLKAPCGPDGCYLATDCAEGSFCYGSNPSKGLMGQCLPTPAAGQCWLDSDCPAQATCEGESSCPVCQPCNTPTLPGVCKAAPGQEAVLLWLAKDSWYSSQPVQPTWFNFTADSIFLPGCATYDVEVLDNGTWVNKGPTLDCGWEGAAIKVPAGGSLLTHASIISLDSASWNYPKYRFRGYWYAGCADGLPVSEAKCTASQEVLSREFVVMWPPD